MSSNELNAVPTEEIEKLIPPSDPESKDDLLSLVGNPVAEADA